MTTQRMVCHIRREDEVNLTHCGHSTEMDYPMITTEPIKMSNAHRGVAIFADTEWPDNTTQCRECCKAYDAWATRDARY